MGNTGLNIFLVDDDKIYQFTSRKIMESLNSVGQVKVFSNGREALTHLQYNSSDAGELPDVIFLDINMPEMNGWEFLQSFDQLHKDLQKPPIVFMVSSSVDEADIKRSKQFSVVSNYLNKPVSREKFLELLDPIAAALRAGSNND